MIISYLHPENTPSQKKTIEGVGLVTVALTDDGAGTEGAEVFIVETGQPGRVSMLIPEGMSPKVTHVPQGLSIELVSSED